MELMVNLQVTRISAYGFVLDGNRLLLCRLSGHVLDAGKWTLPGGAIEFGEAPEAAMAREVEEETGLRVVSAGLAGVDLLEDIGVAELVRSAWPMILRSA